MFVFHTMQSFMHLPHNAVLHEDVRLPHNAVLHEDVRLDSGISMTQCGPSRGFRLGISMCLRHNAVLHEDVNLD